MRNLTSFVFSVLASGCVFYPKLDADSLSRCGGTSRHFELHYLKSNNSPSNSPYQARAGYCDRVCVVAIAVAVTVSSATAIVSGSVVVIGNTVFWVEENAACAALDLREPGEGKRRLAEAARRHEEEAVWKFATNETDRTQMAINLRDYLEHYPHGRHVTEANAKLSEIGAEPNAESQ